MQKEQILQHSHLSFGASFQGQATVPSTKHLLGFLVSPCISAKVFKTVTRFRFPLFLKETRNDFSKTGVLILFFICHLDGTLDDLILGERFADGLIDLLLENRGACKVDQI